MAKFLNGQAEHAQSVAGFIERSTHEALRQDKNPTLLKLAIDGCRLRERFLKHHIRN